MVEVGNKKNQNSMNTADKDVVPIERETAMTSSGAEHD